MRKVMTRTQLRPIPHTPATPAALTPTDATSHPGGTPLHTSAGVHRKDRTDGPAPLATAPPAGTGSPTSRPPGLTALRTPADGPSRTPGGVPPRRPGGSGVARAGAPGGRPPGSPGRSPRTRTRPADTRPPTAGPGRATATGSRRAAPGASAAGPDTPAAVTGFRAAADVRVPAPNAPATHRRSVPAPAAPLVPTQAPRRPVPQLRPTDRFAELLLGVLSGRRPVHSMLRHTAGRAYDELAHLAERGPLRTRGTHPVVRDIGYFEPRPGALEVFARIGAGDQLRAMAFRLEQGRDLRWRCTAVELGGPRRPHTADD
ncbi:Rv3235 family protein [Streptomyces sp. NPDC053750]|uniref:Rv3235 family protein n=1 Tax=Streptomyces sp. NPDC053750 TaxID=3365714 RepID=UPI0037D91D52